MTDNLLQKLEDKMILLLSEFEEMRKENNRLRHENAALSRNYTDYAKKLQGLVSLLDNVTGSTVVEFEKENGVLA